MMMTGLFEQEDSKKAKVIFFFASFLGLAGLSVAIWKLADTYNDSSNTWPGMALLIQCICLMTSAANLFYAQAQRKEDSLGM